MPTSDSYTFYLELLRACFDSASDAIFVLCDEMKFLLCNRVMERWLGESESTLIQYNQRVSITRFFKDSADAERFQSYFMKALQEAPNHFECRLEPPRGSPRWVEFSLNKVDPEAGQMVIGVARDITRHKDALTSLRKLSSAIEQTADTVVITDLSGTIEYVNPAFEATTGFSRDEAVGKTPRIVKSDQHDRVFYEKLWGTILRGDVFRAVFINQKKDGSLYYEEKTITPLRNENGSGRITHFVSTGKDITARIKAQERLDYLAYYDVVTGLPNRNRFHDRLRHALGHSQRHRSQTAILLLNLDNFKSINDSLGHEVGDQLLTAAAARLKSSLRDGDTVARTGSDEFAILPENPGQADNTARIAQKLINDLTKPFIVGGHEIFISMGIGIAISPADGNDVDSLWKNANTAMHRSKESGHSSYKFYSADMTAKVTERLTLSTQLSRATEREEFCLYYQPIVDLVSGRISSVEALIRWQHQDRGIIAPSEFMPVLEESGLIVRVGDWVLRTVCDQLQQWRDLLPEPVNVAVNISGRQFADSAFLDKIACMRCLLKRQGKCAGITEFEITESVVMHNDSTTIGTLKALRESGIRVTIDDFGTGYSCLAYLTRFRVDAVKIDRSFVQGITAGQDAVALVEVIIAMAHMLNLKVIAEGVETSEQFTLLRNLGCDMIQGYAVSRPLPADEMTGLLSKKSKYTEF